MYIRFDGVPERPGVEIPLSAGDAGTDQTVDVMRTLVRRSMQDPVTKAAAVMVTKDVRPMDMDGYVKAVWAGVRDHMMYVPDFFQTEELTSPAIHSRRILNGGKSWGDCDDYTMLGAAWLLCLGVPARFEVIASYKNAGHYDHVRVAALMKSGQWTPLETTMRRVPFGGKVPALRVKVYAI